MALRSRSALLLTTVLLALPLATSALASADPGVPTSGATILGAGFSGKPFVLTDDVIIETNGLYESVRDYADAASPTWLAWHEHTLDGIWHTILHDDGLLVGLRDAVRPGFEVVDVSDPENPVALASVDANHFRSGWLRGHALAVAEETYLVVYDLTDPTAPTFSHFQLLGQHAGARWFSALGSFLYLVDGGATLRVLDVSDPLHPIDLGTVDLPGARIDAVVAGEGVLHVLLAGEGAGASLDLVTYDLAGPLDPQESHRLVHAPDAAVTGRQLVRAGQLLLAGDDAGRIRSYDLSDPRYPVAGYELSVLAEHLAISEHQIFAMTMHDLRIFARTPAGLPPEEPVVRALLPRLRTVDGDGPVQFGQFHDATSMILPVDVSNPRHPRLGEAFDTGLPGAFRYAEGLGLMVNLEGALRVIDLANPFAPQVLGSVDAPRAVFFRARHTRELVVVETGSVVMELRFYDLSDPTAPRLFNKVYDYGLRALTDELMICSRSNRIRIYDVSDPARPRFLRQQPLTGAVHDVVIHQGHAYALCQDLSGPMLLHAVDVRDPGHPELLATVELSHNAGRLDAHEGRVYVYGYHLCQIFDVAQPAQMAVAAEFPSLGHTGSGLGFNGDVTTIGGWLVTMRDDGLAVSAAPDRAPAVASRLEPAYPNPFNPITTLAFTVGRAQQLTLSVHDVRGRLVAELAAGRFEPGRHTVRWNGEDARGRAVASGIYLVRLHGEGLDASRTVTLLK
jgi:hypothetical protein